MSESNVMSDQSEEDAALGSLHSTILPITTDEQYQVAIEKAFDYRGNVSIKTVDGRKIERYMFDRRHDVDEPYVRVIETTTSQRVSIKYTQITSVAFTGVDTAAGKSWRTWVKKVKQSKAHGPDVP